MKIKETLDKKTEAPKLMIDTNSLKEDLAEQLDIVNLKSEKQGIEISLFSKTTKLKELNKLAKLNFDFILNRLK